MRCKSTKKLFANYASDNQVDNKSISFDYFGVNFTLIEFYLELNYKDMLY